MVKGDCCSLELGLYSHWVRTRGGRAEAHDEYEEVLLSNARR